MEFFSYAVGMVCGVIIGFLVGMLAVGYMNYKNAIKEYRKVKDVGGEIYG